MPASDLSRRLNEIAADLREINARLTRTNEGWVNPPQPDVPEVREALNAIKNEANVTTRLANGMLGRLG